MRRRKSRETTGGHPSDTSLAIQLKMKTHSRKIQIERTTTINDNQHILDFTSTEFAEMDPFIADCKVQAMRDGNVYITERPRRKKGTPLFREDNSTLTLGRDNRYYFVFTMPKDQLDILSDRLVHQALAIAQKVDAMVAGRVGKKGSKK